MGRYLGQHFLINKNKLRKIVETLNLKPKEVIIEIGPGHGELTLELRIDPSGILRKKNAELRIIAIEKDEKLFEYLRKKFAFDKNTEIIEGDALKILKSCVLNPKSYKIVGNIPYYITGRLLRIISELENKPSLIVLTIQKEVAERICAVPPRMNLLAASVQFWAKPEIVGYISKKDFQPMPKVDSAIVKLEIKDKGQGTSNAERYYKLIRILFKQPRKTILNNLTMTTTITKEDITKKLKKSGINPQDRPQNLDIKQIKELSTLF